MPVKRASAKYTSNPISSMGDLFGEPELLAGFRYIPDVISTADEKSLVQRFENLPLRPFEFPGYRGNRRIYTFGHRYVFAGQEPRADASIPDYLLPLTDVASRISGVPAEAFEQLMVTEYAPGAGIGWATDRRMKISSQCRFSHLAHCGCVGGWGRAGSAGPRMSSHDRCICSMARCGTAGSTASRRWTFCATPVPCVRFALAEAPRAISVPSLRLSDRRIDGAK